MLRGLLGDISYFISLGRGFEIAWQELHFFNLVSGITHIHQHFRDLSLYMDSGGSHYR
ncbi:hypothetical protein J008_06823 [Cryptococcus neoformans]|nr:hypothetical protein AYX14_03632 [Cryptococcus neoformans var. grubii]OWZ74800.1 hypothetical protein C365_06791 [Cryptococcus neoformans var. grubii Bt85]OXG10495.1 hypothetical protein C366_06739 [Cryptococcus neoformans var. grubii Tu401-1]OXH21359.1 hypothetical protein J008_06823 [Cryptococcus neoformans var. grubii]OXM75687.1 hypothetical protein C364_06715 [Cryptococcus neoformans var. grubii Bt63]